MHLVFEVKGAGGATQMVTASREDDNLTLICDCQTALEGKICVHRMGLLTANVAMLASDNVDDLVHLAEMIKGSDVEVKIREMMQMAQNSDVDPADLENVKHELAEALSD